MRHGKSIEVRGSGAKLRSTWIGQNGCILGGKNQPMDRFKELQTWHVVDDELPYKKTHGWYFEDVTALEEPFLYFIKVLKSGPITAKFSRTDCSTEPRGHLRVWPRWGLGKPFAEDGPYDSKIVI